MKRSREGKSFYLVPVDVQMGTGEMDRFASRVAKNREGHALHVVYFCKLPASHQENVQEGKKDSEETNQIEKIRREGIDGLNHFVSNLEKVHKIKTVTSEMIDCVGTTPKEQLAIYLEENAPDGIILGPRKELPTDRKKFAQTHLGAFGDFVSHLGVDIHWLGQ